MKDINLTFLLCGNLDKLSDEWLNYYHLKLNGMYNFLTKKDSIEIIEKELNRRKALERDRKINDILYGDEL